MSLRTLISNTTAGSAYLTVRHFPYGLCTISMLRGVLFVCALLITFIGSAQTPADSVKVFFRQGHYQFDPTLDNNRAMMDRFISHVRQAANDGDIARIVVRGYTSPEGYNAANERLARKRCEAVKQYIVNNSAISATLIESDPQGIAWGELRNMVADDPAVPYRQRILDIIDNTPVLIYNADGHIISGRNKQLMDLAGGRPYNWLLENIFPQLRNAVAVSLYLIENTKSDLIENTMSDNADSADRSDIPTDPTLSDESVSSDMSDTSTGVENALAASAACADSVEPRERYHFALKTNLLFDAVLLPNLTLEWLINNHWSVGVEGDVAWWSRPERNLYYRIAVIQGEGRYHIRPRAQWHGMYVGVFTGGSWYQLAVKRDKGYKGEGMMAGVSLGYMWPLSRHFSLQAGIGAGYMTTRYKEYTPLDGHKLYLRTKTLSYFGPLKVDLSLVWRFDMINKPLKSSPAL